ncbi:MAG: hypothetical protein ABI954_12435, partial [Pyrinomonadaceae bacterium]
AREAAEDNKERTPYKRKFPATIAEMESRAEKYVTISAAMPDQKAYERPAEFSAVPNGELTFQLAAALRRATATTTWRDVIREVSSSIKNEMPYQDASVEGGKIDSIVFSGTSLKKDASIEIESVKNDTLIFKAGRMSGINIGAQIAIYDETASKFVGTDSWLTNATVTEVRDYKSVAKLSAATNKVTTKSHLVLTAPTFGGTPVSLVLDDTSLQNQLAAEVKTAILAKLKNNPVVTNQLLEIVESVAIAKKTANRTSPILRLKRGSFKQAFLKRGQAVLPNVCMSENDLLPPDDTEIYYLDDGSGLPLLGQFFTSANPNTPDNINKFLSNFAQFRNVQNIENVNSGLSYGIEASIEIQPKVLSYRCQNKDQTRKQAQLVTSCPEQSAQILANGEIPQGAIYRVHIKNTSRFPLYITVLHLSNDGVISKLYPDPKLDKIEALQPGREEFSVLRAASQPSGKEAIKILIVRKAENAKFDYLLTPELTNRPDNTLLGKLLRQSGTKTRDEGLPPDVPDSWGVVTLDYQVTDKIAVCQK